jgi:hypothetical protein
MAWRKFICTSHVNAWIANFICNSNIVHLSITKKFVLIFTMVLVMLSPSLLSAYIDVGNNVFWHALHSKVLQLFKIVARDF